MKNFLFKDSKDLENLIKKIKSELNLIESSILESGRDAFNQYKSKVLSPINKISFPTRDAYKFRWYNPYYDLPDEQRGRLIEKKLNRDCCLDY